MQYRDGFKQFCHHSDNLWLSHEKICLCASEYLGVLYHTFFHHLYLEHKDSEKNPFPEKGIHDKTNLTFTMLAVCIVFIVTTLPEEICRFLLSLSQLFGFNFIDVNHTVVQITYKLICINHSANFMLYCVTGTAFRQNLVPFLQSCKRQYPRSHRQRQCTTVEETVS